MASDEKHQSGVAPILARFKTGAFMDDEAFVYSDPDTGVEGIKLIKESLGELDALGPDGRNALIPLLEDPAAAIRVWAAAALVKVIPERALSVLEEIRDRSLSDAHMTACDLLILYEQGRLNY